MPTTDAPIPGYDDEDASSPRSTIPASPLPLTSISAPRLAPLPLSPPPSDLLRDYLVLEHAFELSRRRVGSGSGSGTG